MHLPVLYCHCGCG